MFLMDLSDKGVLLGSCCFLLNYHQEQIKRKSKMMWVQEVFLKIMEQRVYHNLLQEIHVNERGSYFR